MRSTTQLNVILVLVERKNVFRWRRESLTGSELLVADFDSGKSHAHRMSRWDSLLVCTGALCYRSKLNDIKFNVDIHLYETRRLQAVLVRQPEI